MRRRGCGEDSAGFSAVDPADQAADRSLRFDALWRSLDDLDDETLASVGDSFARDHSDPVVRTRAKLACAQPADRIKALRIVRALKLTRLLEEQIYRLANDPDPVVRSFAVALGNLRLATTS